MPKTFNSCLLLGVQYHLPLILVLDNVCIAYLRFRESRYLQGFRDSEFQVQVAKGWGNIKDLWTQEPEGGGQQMSGFYSTRRSFSDTRYFPSYCETTLGGSPICTAALCLIRTHWMRVVASFPFGPPLLRKKLALRLQEAAEAMGVANARNASLERARLRLQLELGDTLSDLGQARSAAAALNQKQQHFDKSLDDWRRKHEESQAMLDASKKEARALSIQLLELRHSYEEGTMSQEALRRENKHLKGTLC